MDTEKSCPHCDRTKHREGSSYRDLIVRLNKIEGQVRGVRKMVEDDRYCIDIINQVSAIRAALTSFNSLLLSEHISTCVVDDVREGNSELVDELCAVLQKLMK